MIIENNKSKLLSHRNIPLIEWDMYDDGEDIEYPYLTVENYDKWYCVYLVKEDGEVDKIHIIDELKEESLLTWHDHAISPHYFHELSIHFKASYPSQAMTLVCKRFVDDAMNGDWTQLHKHLPIGK